MAKNFREALVVRLTEGPATTVQLVRSSLGAFAGGSAHI